MDDLKVLSYKVNTQHTILERRIATAYSASGTRRQLDLAYFLIILFSPLEQISVQTCAFTFFYSLSVCSTHFLSESASPAELAFTSTVKLPVPSSLMHEQVVTRSVAEPQRWPRSIDDGLHVGIGSALDGGTETRQIGYRLRASACIFPRDYPTSLRIQAC